MNENDFREALRSTMTTVAEPPPMDSAAAVTAGRRAAGRRAGLSAAGAAAAVLVVAGLAAGPARQWLPGDDGAGPAWDAAGAPSALPTPSARAGTKPAWPTEASGKPQQDATARSGPRYEQGRKLFEQLLAVVPDGYTTPTGSARDGIPLQDHQAAVEDKAWGYLASVAVRREGRTGRLLAEVHTPGNGLPTQACKLARAFWGMGGQCDVVAAGGAEVGVVVRPGQDDRLDQWAAYRHPDGTVVYVAQSRNATNADSEFRPLTELPLTVPELAALAVQPRFHLR
jgi:hypothetical protein